VPWVVFLFLGAFFAYNIKGNAGDSGGSVIGGGDKILCENCMGTPDPQIIDPPEETPDKLLKIFKFMNGEELRLLENIGKQVFIFETKEQGKVEIEKKATQRVFNDFLNAFDKYDCEQDNTKHSIAIHKFEMADLVMELLIECSQKTLELTIIKLNTTINISLIGKEVQELLKDVACLQNQSE
jgi:hypothetical protein